MIMDNATSSFQLAQVCEKHWNVFGDGGSTDSQVASPGFVHIDHGTNDNKRQCSEKPKDFQPRSKMAAQ